MIIEAPSNADTILPYYDTDAELTLLDELTSADSTLQIKTPPTEIINLQSELETFHSRKGSDGKTITDLQKETVGCR